MPTLSPSAERALKQLEQHEAIHAADFVNELIRIHPEYASGRVTKLELSPDEHLPVRPARQWLDDLQSVLNPDAVDQLHGRLVIAGLAVLEPAVGMLLARHGVLQALQSEIKEPLEEVFEPEALRTWHSYLPKAATSPDRSRSGASAFPDIEAKTIDDREETPASETVRRTETTEDQQETARRADEQPPPDEVVPTHLDNPAFVDQLGRRPFAKVVATRIQEVRRHGSFMVHLHGRWGAGKTSVLNFLRDELTSGRQGDRWIVVDFNAWRNQRLSPPWWSLIHAIQDQAAEQLGDDDALQALKLRGLWFWWKLRADWLPGVVAAAFILAAIGIFSLDVESGPKVIMGLLTAAAALYTASRTLVFGSSQAAKKYLELSSDPMEPMVGLFARLIARIDRPVAIFIDDLDRCSASYVVELLEGIQTLFREAPATYVVAADRNWIRASFEQVYGPFSDTIHEPGRPLGYLFLEKVFQFSATLPLLSPTTQTRYWHELLQRAESGDHRDLEKQLEEAEREAESLLGEARTGDAMQAVIDEHQDDAVLEQGLRAAAAKRVTSSAAQSETEHMLKPFAHLLEPNPRAMKRLVNAFGLHQAVNFLEGRKTAVEPLALWSIIELRWPILADYLAADPARIRVAIDGAASADGEATEEVRRLLADPNVRSVVRGIRPDGEFTLDESALRRTIGLAKNNQDGGLR